MKLRGPNLFQPWRCSCAQKQRYEGQWFAMVRVEELTWPVQNPDLSLAEHFWGNLECCLCTRPSHLTKIWWHCIRSRGLNLEWYIQKAHMGMMVMSPQTSGYIGHSDDLCMWLTRASLGGGCFLEQPVGLYSVYCRTQVTDGHTQNGLRPHSEEGRDARQIEILLQQLELREREERWRQTVVSCPDTKGRFGKLQLELHNIHDLQIKYPAFISP